MSKDAKRRAVKRGSTLRLEIHVAALSGIAAHLSCQEEGELMQMLMDEAAGCDVAPADSDVVNAAFARRAEFRRIKGGFGRSTLSVTRRRRVYERDNRRCTYCAKPISWDEYHCDHIEPVSKGGSDGLENLAASCAACNLSKKAKALSEWRQ